MVTIHPNILERDGKKAFVVLPYEEFVMIEEETQRILRPQGTARREGRRGRGESALPLQEPRRNWDCSESMFPSFPQFVHLSPELQPNTMPKSKILIADDNGPNVELLEAYLDGLDCEIAVAVDGRDTLAKVAEFQLYLILLDIMMPKLYRLSRSARRSMATRKPNRP